MEDEVSVDCSTDVMENGKGKKANDHEDDVDDVVELNSDNADTKDVEFAEEVINLDDKESGDDKPSKKGDKKNADSDKEGSKDREGKDEKKKKLPSIEEDIGITAYAGEHSGFFGIIKQRYSDFQVNEVDGNGEMIRITDQDIPDEPEEIPDMPEVMPPELTDVKFRELDRMLGLLKKQESNLNVDDEAEVKDEEEPEVVEDEEMREVEEIKEVEVIKEVEEIKVVKAKDVKTKEVKTKEVKTKEIKTKDVKTKDVKAKDVKAKDVDVKDVKTVKNVKDVKDAKDVKDVKDAKDVKDVKDVEDVKDVKDVKEIKEVEEDKEESKDESADEKDEDEVKDKDSTKKDDTSKDKKAEKTETTLKENLPSLTEIWINVDVTDEAGIALIQQAIKAKYRGVDSVYGETPDGGRYVVVRKRKAGSVRRDKTGWPKDQLYTTFVLYKENVETVEAINQIAWKARVKPSNFTYAGTKDKRAKTSQLVSIKEVAPQRLWLATKNLRSIHIGNFHFREKPQRLNLQFGNHYRIVLREVDGTDEEILEAVESLKTKGFINYYGTQPFGNNCVFMRGIGCELLKGNWQQAVNLILAPRDNDVPDLHRCHTTWKETGDAEAALKMLCKGWEATVENQLLTGLSQLTGNDLVEALNRIPRTTRTLYLHAYQSWMWNTIASRRVQKYGLKVLPGDIVRRKGSNTEVDEMEDENNENEAEGEESKDESESKPEMETTEANGQNMSGFHFLTEEEAEVADIADVVLPLPGYNVEYPNNEIKEWYAEMLETDGLTFNALKHEIKAYAARGVYRRMVVVPTNTSGKVCYYRDASKSLLQSDMDKLWGIKVDDNVLKDGPNKSVIVEMTLPSSSYASVALRELLKRDTSWQVSKKQFQAAQNMPSNVIDRSRDVSGRGRGGRGAWRGSDRGTWKPTPWASSWRDDRTPAWQQQGRGRGTFSPWADQGGFRNREYGWNSNRGGYGAHVTYGANSGWGRGDKRIWRGGDSWANKRGRF